MTLHQFLAGLVRKGNGQHEQRKGSRLHRTGGTRNDPRHLSDPATGWILAGITALLVVGWLGAVFLIEPIRFVIYNPRSKTGFELFLALGQMFGALVLVLSPVESARPRMRWIATGLLTLGVGALGFGYLYPSIDDTPQLNVTMYGSLFVRSMATILLVIGLVPTNPPPLSRRVATALMGGGGIVSLVLILVGDRLPLLLRVADIESLLATTTGRTLPGLTAWHLGLGLIPLTAGIAAAWGAVRHYRDAVLGRWLVVAIVLLAGAQLHAMFWPSMYTSVITTTSVLRLGLTAVIIVGGVAELRHLSLERAALLAQEQERVQQLEDLSVLKRDFTAIVAHELGTPLAAIASLAELLSMGVLPAIEQQQAVERIQGEARILQLFVRDIQASTDIDRDDFSIDPRTVSLCSLLDDAQAYAGMIQSAHRLTLEAPSDITVLADPVRIAQVIRNLLNNAIRHTPSDTPITLRAMPLDDKVRIDVADLGPGIDPADQARILDKYSRGANAESEGRGLGLYLSQRILQAHGTKLAIESEPGHGACFSFQLKAIT